MKFKSFVLGVLTVALFLTCSLAYVSSIDAYVRVKRDSGGVPHLCYHHSNDKDEKSLFNKRQKRDFSWVGLGQCIAGTVGGIASGATIGFLRGAEAGRSKSPAAAAAGGVIGGTGGAIGGGLTGVAATCF